jgi:hypothetical protein
MSKGLIGTAMFVLIVAVSVAIGMWGNRKFLSGGT